MRPTALFVILRKREDAGQGVIRVPAVKIKLSYSWKAARELLQRKRRRFLMIR